MSATNFSMIWAQLASPLQASGMVPFVDTDNASITGDVLDFNYSKTNADLLITGGITIGYDASKVANPSPVSLTTIAGRVTVAIGTNSVVVNDPLIRAGAFPLLTRRATDATATQIAAVCGVGTLTITTNANATAGFAIDFLIINSSHTAG